MRKKAIKCSNCMKKLIRHMCQCPVQGSEKFCSGIWYQKWVESVAKNFYLFTIRSRLYLISYYYKLDFTKPDPICMPFFRFVCPFWNSY